jgi:hypothetical protein
MNLFAKKAFVVHLCNLTDDYQIYTEKTLRFPHPRYSKRGGESDESTGEQNAAGGDERDINKEIDFKPEDLDMLLSNAIDPLLAGETTHILEFKETDGKKQKHYRVLEKNITPIYPFDTVAEMKIKLFNAIGIPRYRQHVWSDKTGPLSYAAFLQGIQQIISISTFLGAEERAGDIPVDMRWYTYHDTVRIKAMDEFVTMGECFARNPSNEWYFLDAALLLPIFKGKLYGGEGPAGGKIDDMTKQIWFASIITPLWPMITKDLWNSILEGESELLDRYPSLHYRNNYTIEETFFNRVPSSTLNFVISEATITYFNHKKPNVHLLNLIDRFELTEVYDSIRYRNLAINVHKVWSTKPTDDNIFKPLPGGPEYPPLDMVCIRIRKTKDTTLYLYISAFGNIIIKGHWNDEDYFDYAGILAEIETYVTPALVKINKLNVVEPGYQLEYPEDGTPRFSDINAGFYLERSLSDNEYASLRDHIRRMVECGMIIQKDVDTKNVLDEYYFRKGMHEYDIDRLDKFVGVANQYEYLTNSVIRNKFETLFTMTRTLKITRRATNVKFDVTGIRESETQIVEWILRALCDQIKWSKIRENLRTDVRSAIVDNKEQDPELYDGKRWPGKNFVYSRICQKQYQPRILTEEEYTKLPKHIKVNAVQYWNFTKQKKVWYSCPRAKYPYLRFVTNRHPAGYCIPCCAKTPARVRKRGMDIKYQIHQACLSQHMWTKEKKNAIEGSRHILTWGKAIEPGRLSYLPDKTLEPLFLDHAKNITVDQECHDASGFSYYVYGIHQSMINATNIGIVYAISVALQWPVPKFLNEVSKRIMQNQDRWASLSIRAFISKPAELVGILLKLNDKLENFDKYTKMWNIIFSDIAFYYFGINVIIFKETPAGDDFILRVPEKLYEHVAPDSHLNLLLIETHANTVWPIFRLNPTLYFKTKLIEKTLFARRTEIIYMIEQLLASKLASSVRTGFDLNIIIEFTTYSRKQKGGLTTEYGDINDFEDLHFERDRAAGEALLPQIQDVFRTDDTPDTPDSSGLLENKEVQGGAAPKFHAWIIDHVYVDVNGVAYAVQCSSRSEKSIKIVWPILPAPLKVTNITIVRAAPDRNITTIEHILLFAREIDRWAKLNIANVIYPYVEPNRWLILADHTEWPLKIAGPIIGFIHQGLHYMFRNITQSDANSRAKIPTQVLLFDQYHVLQSVSAKPLSLRETKDSQPLLNAGMFDDGLTRLRIWISKQSTTGVRKSVQNLFSKVRKWDDELASVSLKLKTILTVNDYTLISDALSTWLNEPNKKLSNLIDKVNSVRLESDLNAASDLSRSQLESITKLHGGLLNILHNELQNPLRRTILLSGRWQAVQRATNITQYPFERVKIIRVA